MLNSVNESREDRFRRLALRDENGRHPINELKIKIANHLSEWKASYRLHYAEYLKKGYTQDDVPSRMIFNIHNILPETVVLIAKKSDLLVSTVTQFFDTPNFGLPLDTIYKKELDQLRAQGRVISEVGALVTGSDYRQQHLFMHLCQAMYWYARSKKVDDLCLAVNPKHVQFYKTVYCCEVAGPEKFYPKVHAPAVLMRLDTTRHEGKMRAAYCRLEDGCNLHNRWHKMDGKDITDFAFALRCKNILDDKDQPAMDSTDVNIILSHNREILNGLTLDQAYYLKSIYPQIKLLHLVHSSPSSVI